MKALLRSGLLLFFAVCTACTPLIAPPVPATRPGAPMPTITKTYLDQGKRYFETGLYTRAMRELLPLACDGVAEAQYAVGYMYYYGYGVAQDPWVGFFWIDRAAKKGLIPAIEAAKVLSKKENWPPTPAENKRFGR